MEFNSRLAWHNTKKCRLTHTFKSGAEPQEIKLASPCNQMKQPEIIYYTLLIENTAKAHLSSFTLAILSYSVTNKQLGPNHTEKVRKHHNSINIDALTTTLALLNSLFMLKRTSMWLCVYTSVKYKDVISLNHEDHFSPLSHWNILALPPNGSIPHCKTQVTSPQQMGERSLKYSLDITHPICTNRDSQLMHEVTV